MIKFSNKMQSEVADFAPGTATWRTNISIFLTKATTPFHRHWNDWRLCWQPWYEFRQRLSTQTTWDSRCCMIVILVRINWSNCCVSHKEE